MYIYVVYKLQHVKIKIIVQVATCVTGTYNLYKTTLYRSMPLLFLCKKNHMRWIDNVYIYDIMQN